LRHFKTNLQGKIWIQQKDGKREADISTFSLDILFLDFWTRAHFCPAQYARLLGSFKGVPVVCVHQRSELQHTSQQIPARLLTYDPDR